MERATGESYNLEIADFFPVEKNKTLLYNALFNWEPYVLKDVILILYHYLTIPDDDVRDQPNNSMDMTKDDIERYIRTSMSTRSMPQFYSVDTEDEFGEARKEFISYEEHLENLHRQLTEVYKTATSSKNLTYEANQAHLKDCRLAIIFGLCMDDRVKRLFFGLSDINNSLCVLPSSTKFQTEGMKIINELFEELKEHGDEVAFAEQCMKIIKHYEK